jgi:Colicin V production protein
MALAMTIVVALVLVLLALVGAWRDLQRGALALGGSLLGFVLGELWGVPWGDVLVERLRVNSGSAVFVVQMLLLLGSALVLGYGSGTLLPPRASMPPWPRRLAGGLLGLLNGVMLVGFLLRYGVVANPGFATLVAESTLARLIHTGLPVLFILVSAVAGVAICGRLLVEAIRARQAAPPALSHGRGGPPEADSLSPSYERRLNQQRALSKVSDKLDEIEHGR